jgi:hypothetical protein
MPAFLAPILFSRITLKRDRDCQLRFTPLASQQGRLTQSLSTKRFAFSWLF